MDQLHTGAVAAAARLVARGETLAIAESSAGGLISAALLAVPGASRFYLGGNIVYTPRALKALRADGVAEVKAAGMRSSTEDYAVWLATSVREAHRASWGLSETGAAGPDGNVYGDPAGHSCVALVGPTVLARTIETGDADRGANMMAFACAAMDLLVAGLGEA